MNTDKYREFGAVLFALQGVVTALAPQVSIRMIRRMIGKNFENADQLEAKPVYLRQLRAIGVGMAAAGVANFALQRANRETGGNDAGLDETDDETDPADESGD